MPAKYAEAVVRKSLSPRRVRACATGQRKCGRGWPQPEALALLRTLFDARHEREFGRPGEADRPPLRTAVIPCAPAAHPRWSRPPHTAGLRCGADTEPFRDAGENKGPDMQRPQRCVQRQMGTTQRGWNGLKRLAAGRSLSRRGSGSEQTARANPLPSRDRAAGGAGPGEGDPRPTRTPPSGDSKLAATLRKRSSAASRLSTISAAISSGGGSRSGSSRLSSFSQKISRLTLSRLARSS